MPKSKGPFRFRRTASPQQGRGIPILAVVHKGAPREEIVQPGGKVHYSRGRDLTYFRFDFNAKDEALANFIASLGPEPEEIRFVLPFPSVDANFQFYNEAYKGGIMVHRCSPDPDRPIILSALDPKTLRRTVAGGLSVETGEPVMCDGKSIYSTQADEYFCSPIMRLGIMPLGIPRFGQFLVGSTSKMDGEMLTMQLNMLHDEVVRHPRLRENGLRGVPLVLHRTPRKTVWYDDSGARKTTNPSLLWVEPGANWYTAYAEHLAAASIQMLTSGDMSEPDEEGNPALLAQAMDATLAEAEPDGETGQQQNHALMALPAAPEPGKSQAEPAAGWPTSQKEWATWIKHYGVTGKSVNSELHGSVADYIEGGHTFEDAARILWAALALRD